MLERVSTPPAILPSLSGQEIHPPAVTIESFADLPHNPAAYLAHLLTIPQLPASTPSVPEPRRGLAHLRQTYTVALTGLQAVRRQLNASAIHLEVEPVLALPEITLNAEPAVKYETRWSGAITLEELLADTQVRKVAFAKMRSLGYIGEDAQDCFQLGTINLWKSLQAQSGLLSDKGAAWVGVWIAYSGSRRSLWKHKARSVPLHDPELSRYIRPERWASWATRVDKRIDFTLLMNTFAQRYDDNPLKLFALYSLTTSVKMKDVQSVAHADKNQLIQARNAVKHDLRELLLDDESHRSDALWLEQLRQGENLACVTQVAEQVMDNQRLLLALYIVTTSATRKDVTSLFGIPLTKFRQDIIQVKHLLAAAFRKTKADLSQER